MNGVKIYARYMVLPVILVAGIWFLNSCGGGSSSDSAPIDVEETDLFFVQGTFPKEGEWSVPPGISLWFDFNNTLESDSINEQSVALECNDEFILGVPSHFSGTLAFTPETILPFNANCSATVSGVKDETGNSLSSDFQINFQIASFNESRPELIRSVSPGEFQTGVYPDSQIRVYFQSDVDPSTVNSNNFSVIDAHAPVAGTLEVVGSLIIFTPDSWLEYGTIYHVRLDRELGTLSGTTLGEDYLWNFTTLPIIGEEEIVTSQSEKINSPLLHADGTGQLMLVWGQGGGVSSPNTSIRWSVYTQGVGWSSPSVLISDPSYEIDNIQFVGNNDGVRFLIWRQHSVGWRACRYDPQQASWESPVDLTDIPPGCAGLVVCSGGVGGLTAGEDGSAVLGFIEITPGNPNPTSKKAKVIRYEVGAGWQSSEDLETTWLVGYSVAGIKIRFAVGGQGNILAAWSASAGSYTVELRANRFTNGAGWNGTEVLDRNSSYNSIYINNSGYDSSDNGWVLWRVEGIISASHYLPSVGWSLPRGLAAGYDSKILFDSAGGAMVLIKDSNTTRAASYSPGAGTGWSTIDQLPTQGPLSGWLGDSGTRAVALIFYRDHLWRLIYTPEQLWGVQAAIGLYDWNAGDYPGRWILLPDGTGVIAWTKRDGIERTVGVTRFN